MKKLATIHAVGSSICTAAALLSPVRENNAGKSNDVKIIRTPLSVPLRLPLSLSFSISISLSLSLRLSLPLSLSLRSANPSVSSISPSHSIGYTISQSSTFHHHIPPHLGIASSQACLVSRRLCWFSSPSSFLSVARSPSRHPTSPSAGLAPQSRLAASNIFLGGSRCKLPSL